jgi:hypothetical protein
MEYNQMKRQIANLKLFFYAISMIITIKYLVQAFYDLFFFFFNQQNKFFTYVFTASFYTSEIAIVLLMCKSIKETVRAERQYEQMQRQHSSQQPLSFS